ncbi:MAG: serine/threonine protein kinase [Sedimentisphaerales bacterium]|nr:serine/threonine protein kinase [Sedimentisphaerales bacterium]
MNESNSDNSSRGNDLPTVSGPTSARPGSSKTPPPAIEGYEIIGELGEAGQGRVWRARQLSTRREVALKVPRVELLSSKKVLARFEREVELAARLKHPNIAAIYDSGIYQGLYYYAMELIEGVPLDEYVKRNDLTERRVADLMCTICRALSHAHQNGVIHRDIKPSNIMVTEDGSPHVVDFGLAMNILETDASGTVSIAGEVTGTPAYMSPEQATGKRENIDTRTDVYSIGVVFYRVLTGSFPYDVKTSMLETLRSIQEDEPVRPSKLDRDIDSDIEAIVLKALAKEPDQRYQSAAEMQGDIERWLNGLPILAKADNSLYLLRKMINKHRYAASVLALLAIIVLGYATVVIQLYGRLRRSNIEQNIAIDSLHEQLSSYTDIVRLEVFGRLLDAWHRDDSQSVQYAASTFKGIFREDKAARLLAAQMTEQTPLEEKLAAFRKALEADEPAFLEFIIAEHYFKNDRKAEAQQAYRRCLALHKPDIWEDRWLAVRARSRLFMLTAEDAQKIGTE